MATARYWRLLCDAAQVPGAFYRVGDIEMSLTSGGTDLCTGGTAIGDDNYYPAARAFDGSIAANSGDWAGSPGAGRWIGYDFGVATEIKFIRVINTNTANGGELDQLIKDFTVQTSPDGSTWTTLMAFTGHPRTSSASVEYGLQTFTVSGTVLDEGVPVARTVRLYVRSTGALLDEMVSDNVTGAFEFTITIDDPVYAVVLDDGGKNALVFDHLVGVVA